MPLRSPKIYSFIFGFQRLVWCPKWTPASSNSFIDIAGKMPPDHITCHTETRAVQSEICAVRYSRLVELGSNIAEPEAVNRLRSAGTNAWRTGTACGRPSDRTFCAHASAGRESGSRVS